MTDTPEALVKAIKRKTRKKHEPEEKIRIVLCKSSDDLGHIASRTKGDICSIAFA
jgi:hypothetical protein